MGKQPNEVASVHFSFPRVPPSAAQESSPQLSFLLPYLSLSLAGEKECGESGCGCDHSKNPPPLAGFG